MDNAAILLLAHGTPDRLSEMAEYLHHVTGGRPMPPHVVEELQHRYAEIGLRDEPLPEGPPLTRWTLEQARLLSDQLDVPVYVGMRNWHPFIAETVAQMKADSVQHAKVLCLAPQNSRTSTGLYRRALEAALAETPGEAFSFNFIAGWADEPLLAEAFAERLQTALAIAAEQQRLTGNATRIPVLFTAHSVPCRTIRPASTAQAAEGSAARPGAPVPTEGIQNYGSASAGDPYPDECKQAAAAVARLLGLNGNDWHFAFQSQGVAGAPWLGPSVEDTLRALAAEGFKAVVMQPIGFLCDHVEVLYDIDIHFRNLGRELGLDVTRAESLNDSPLLIQALEHVLVGPPPQRYPDPLAVLSSEVEVQDGPLPEPADAGWVSAE